VICPAVLTRLLEGEHIGRSSTTHTIDWSRVGFEQISHAVLRSAEADGHGRSLALASTIEAAMSRATSGCLSR